MAIRFSGLRFRSAVPIQNQFVDGIPALPDKVLDQHCINRDSHSEMVADHWLGVNRRTGMTSSLNQKTQTKTLIGIVGAKFVLAGYRRACATSRVAPS
ncbi:hypothetical protein [Novosphingobium aquae]|uniref:Uncharacterized protein n=1 Tax=Novosphingobium aquae TaxID=3133435 RepID=A0ABU8SC07_9SPHN